MPEIQHDNLRSTSIDQVYGQCPRESWMPLLKCLLVFVALASSIVHAHPQNASISSAVLNTALADRYEKMLEYSYPLYNPNDASDLVGYAFEISSGEYAGQPTSGDIIFVPGFSISAGTGAASVAGGISSYLDSFKQLKTTDFHSRSNASDGLPANWHFSSYVDYLSSKLGYRVWLIDYVNNHARVQRNSLAVQALLQDPVYRYTSGSSNNHIFGYSMGGLVARHALLKLEQLGITHNLGSYVSLDVPHRGAFLPPSIEVVTRTIPRMANGGSVEFALTTFESEFRRYLQPLNSDAAKQLLGVYIGSGVPDMASGRFGRRSKTADFKAYENLFSSIEENNALAPHPAFYELRQELIALGGYPSSTVNVGVSFGAEDGAVLRPASSRSLKPLEWNISQGSFTLARARYFSPRGDTLCSVDMVGRTGRDCPALRLTGGHLESILVAPGSTTSVYADIAEGVQSGADAVPDSVSDGTSPVPLGSLGSPVGSSFGNGTSKAVAIAAEKLTTFIPTVSAWDDDGWAYTYLNADGQDKESVDTPFDLVLANPAGLSTEHTFITAQMSRRIFARLASASSIPGSSFFNAAGRFDTRRYRTVESRREIPLDDSDKSAPRLLSTSEIAALIALF